MLPEALKVNMGALPIGGSEFLQVGSCIGKGSFIEAYRLGSHNLNEGAGPLVLRVDHMSIPEKDVEDLLAEFPLKPGVHYDIENHGSTETVRFNHEQLLNFGLQPIAATINNYFIGLRQQWEPEDEIMARKAGWRSLLNNLINLELNNRTDLAAPPVAPLRSILFRDRNSLNPNDYYFLTIEPEHSNSLSWSEIAGNKGFVEHVLFSDFGPLAVAQTYQVMAQMGIKQRDIKPTHIKTVIEPDQQGSIVVTKSHVIDQGNAVINGLTDITINRVQGTPLFMSPEALIRRDYPISGEIYSFILTLFEATMGQSLRDANVDPRNPQIRKQWANSLPEYLNTDFIKTTLTNIGRNNLLVDTIDFTKLGLPQLSPDYTAVDLFTSYLQNCLSPYGSEKTRPVSFLLAAFLFRDQLAEDVLTRKNAQFLTICFNLSRVMDGQGTRKLLGIAKDELEQFFQQEPDYLNYVYNILASAETNHAPKQEPVNPLRINYVVNTICALGISDPNYPEVDLHQQNILK